MSIIEAVLAFLKLAGQIFGLIEQERQIGIGEQMATGAAAEKANADVAKAIDAERASNALPVSADRLPNADSRD